MKHLSLFILSLFFSTSFFSQAFNISVAGTSLCAGSTQSAVITATNPAATHYTWTASSGTCTGSVTWSGIVAYINYPCCGTFSVICTAMNGTTVVGSVGQLVSVACAQAPTTTITYTPQPLSTCSAIPFTLTVNGPSPTFTWNTGSNAQSIVVTPTVTTLYNVGTFTSAGCITRAAATISVFPTPTINASPLVMCSGNTTTMTASGASNYTWFPGAINSQSLAVSPSVSTVYSITGIDLNGCTNSRTLQMVVNNNPTLSIMSPGICMGSSVMLTVNGANTYTWYNGIQNPTFIVTPTITSTYSVIGSILNCTGSITSTVTVNPNPTITLQSQTICAGSQATLAASGASSYTWNNGSNSNTLIHSGNQTAYYSVVGSSNAGCVKIQTVMVSVVPLPTLNITSSNICLGGNASLTVGGAGNYLWSNGSTSSVVVVSPTVNSTYTVIGYNTQCSSSVNVSVGILPNPTITINTATVCAGNTLILQASGASTFTWNNGVNSSTILLTPFLNSTISVIGKSAAGCTASATSNIYVIQGTPISVNQASICAGDSVILSATGVQSYSWNGTPGPSTLMVSPLTSVVYTVTGISGTCNAISSNTALVTVFPLPIVKSQASPTLLCKDDEPVNLSGNPAGGIFTGLGVNGNMFYPSSSLTGNPILIYTYTDQNQCSNTSILQFNISECTSITEQTNQEFQLYPNPSSDIVYIRTDYDTEIEIKDCLGREVKRFKIPIGLTQLNISSLGKGLYYVKGQHDVIKLQVLN